MDMRAKKLIAGIVLTGMTSIKTFKTISWIRNWNGYWVGYPNEHLAGDTDKNVTSPLYATAVGL